MKPVTEGASVPNVAQTTAKSGVYTFNDVVLLYHPETENVQFSIEAGFIEEDFVRAAINDSSFEANSTPFKISHLRNVLFCKFSPL